MDAKVKITCPYCSQSFGMKSVRQQQKCRLPLLLNCGHNACQVCIENMLKFAEPIECKICSKDMTIDGGTKMLINTNLYSVFPVNIYLLGELYLQLTNEPSPQVGDTPDAYIDVQAIIKSVDAQQGHCVECQIITTKMCKQCETILCNNCFNKTHKFHVFKSHALKDIEINLDVACCKIHSDKQLDYYCNDCKKPICMDCMIVGGEKSCKNHDVVSVQEVNDGILDELSDLSPKVDETFRRLTKTAVDIGNLLRSVESDSGGTNDLDKTIMDIQNHFSKLHATIQKHEYDIMNTMEHLKSVEKKSLNDAKSQVASALKQAKILLKKIDATMTSENQKKANLTVLLQEAKEVLKSPWYLMKEEKKGEKLKVVVNEDLCTLANDYVQVAGNVDTAYCLRTAQDLPEGVELPPPPSVPVFPPEIIKDIRGLGQFKPKHDTKMKRAEQPYLVSMPKYRSKSGSVSSLNSLDSDSSYKRGRASNASGESFHTPLVQPVSPFAESNHPKQLHEGSQELIYISHIISPHDFYVQRACHQNFVKTMFREFRNANTLPKPSLNHIAEGKIYLVYIKADKEWQRCRIVSIDRSDPNKPIFTVFCIDFGSTELVNIDKLRLIPAARVQSPPPLAINCCLDNLEPITGCWTPADSVLMQQIMDNKQAVLHVFGVSAGGACGVRVRCDVCALHDGTSLAKALLFHERAKRINYNIPFPKSVGLTEQPTLFSGIDYKPKAIEEVILTHVVNPDKFYVRKTHLHDTFDKLCDDMDESYSLSLPIGAIHCPEVGMVCAVNIDGHPELGDGGFRRCVITGLPGRAKVKCVLPDTGKDAVMPASVLRQLKHEHARIKPLATECHLSGITPLNKKWSLNSVALMNTFVKKPLELHVEEVSRGKNSVGVTLYDKSDPENPLCINTHMIKFKFAISIGMFGFNKNPVTEELVYTNKSPLSKPKPKPVQKNEVTVLKRTQPLPDKDVKDDDLEAKDKGPIKLEVKILSCQSPSLVYVSLIDQQKTVKEMFDNIQEYYTNNETPGKENWEVGDKCCTICKDSNTWRRANIMELKDDTAKVFFSDFAVVNTVKRDQLKVLTKEFETIGDAAIKCHLSGIMPAVGDEWPSLTKEYLRELVDAYQRFFITKNGAIKDKSLPVELWVYHVIQGGALEPNTAEWRCINHKIIEQGLAVPDKEQVKSSTSKGDDIISFFDVSGSVNEWLALQQPVTETPAPATLEQVDIEDEAPEDNKVYVTDWLPPEPLTNHEFTGYPTYVDNDGIIFLHDISQRDTLDLIRNALDVRFRYPPASRAAAAWRVGQICAARFYLDNKFYRGRITEVNQETQMCIVHYVDYGNDEACAFEDLRKTIVLHEIPVQAHRCSLAGIKPVNGAWDKTTLDYIHKSVVEKQCFVNVADEIVDGIVPIKLKIDKLWLNAHLVDFEMAVYTDGHKRVVTKFAPPPAPAEEVDSEPDYIVETEDTADTSTDTFDLKDMSNKDWSTLVEEEEKKKEELNGSFVVFPENHVGKEFLCNVVFINNDVFELAMVQNEETAAIYNEMFEKLQQCGKDAPEICGMFENKACLALFPEDGRWYRAVVIGVSRKRTRVRVRYVDFGNVDIVPKEDVREIPPEFLILPPATISAELHQVELHPCLDSKLVHAEFENTFLLDGPFHANVIENEGSLLKVELTKGDGSLVYENLIQNGIFIKT